MTFPSSGLSAYVLSVLNTTVAQSAINVAAPNTIPTANKYTAVGVTGGPSLSLTASGYGGSQGTCANPSADWSSVKPQSLCNVENTIITQANLVYRI